LAESIWNKTWGFFVIRIRGVYFGALLMAEVLRCCES
jgi:hypothetical protein